MLCSKCGTENDHQVDVCTQCGEKLTKAAQPEDSAKVQQAEAETEVHETIEWDTDKPKPRITNIDFQSNNSKDEPVVSPGLNIIILLGSVFLPIIGIAMGIAYLRKQHPDAKKMGKIWLICGLTLFLVHGLIIMSNLN